MAENSIKVAVRVRSGDKNAENSRIERHMLASSQVNEKARKQSLQYQQSQHLSCVGDKQIAINCGIDSRHKLFSESSYM